MKPFTLPLPGSVIATGLRTQPPITPPAKGTPLIVAIHGGGYTSTYYNALPTHSAAPYSAFLNVPFLALDRPGYANSSPLPTPFPEGSTYLQEEGKFLHNVILPAIWKAYGEEYRVDSIVIVAHSLSVPMSIVAAALNAESSSSDRSEAYPLASLVFSGYGMDVRAEVAEGLKHTYTDGGEERTTMPTQLKDMLMLGGTQANLVDEAIFAQTETLATSVGKAEFRDCVGPWKDYWMKYAGKVKVPILYGLAGEDGL